VYVLNQSFVLNIREDMHPETHADTNETNGAVKGKLVCDGDESDGDVPGDRVEAKVSLGRKIGQPIYCLLPALELNCLKFDDAKYKP
jgi:hypothetical protein